MEFFALVSDIFMCNLLTCWFHFISIAYFRHSNYTVTFQLHVKYQLLLSSQIKSPLFIWLFFTIQTVSEQLYDDMEIMQQSFGCTADLRRK